MKVGIITWHYGNNHGSVLQALSLCSFLNENGIDAKILNYTPSPYRALTPLRHLIYHLLAKIIKRLWSKDIYTSDKFRLKYVKQTKCLYSKFDLTSESSNFDVIICGSDQIWAPNQLDGTYFVDFAKDSTKRISYAASIGLNDIPESLTNVYKHYLENFYSVSVRENRAVEILKTKCNINATLVVDPTLLHDYTFYSYYEEEIERLKSSGFIFCYFLNDKHEYAETVKAFASKVNIPIVGISYNEYDDTWMTRLKDVHSGNFLWLIHNALYIFTDSYHGSIFSLIYHKKFWLFRRFKDNDLICQNSRIVQLSEYFNIDNLIINPTTIIDKEPYIDYDNFERTVYNLRKKSIEFLLKSLEQC